MPMRRLKISRAPASNVSLFLQLLDEIDENPFLPFIVGDGDEELGLMEALLGLLSSVSMRQEHGREVCLLIALLLQFRKFEVSRDFGFTLWLRKMRLDRMRHSLAEPWNI